MSEQILQALALLDPSNDDHWTADGAPRVDVVQGLTGLKELKRADLISLAPELTRDSARASLLASSPDVSQDSPQTDPVAETQDSEELLSAKERYVKVGEEIAEKRAEINTKTLELTKLIAEQDQLIIELEPLTPSHTKNQHNIMEFLAGQQRQREARFAQQQAIFKGVNPTSLDPRSKLDQAFARKNARGSQAPGREKG